MASLADVVNGIQLLSKYMKNGTASHDISASHDVIYAGPATKDAVSEEDQRRLDELGWHFDRSVDSWARFV